LKKRRTNERDLETGLGGPGKGTPMLKVLSGGRVEQDAVADGRSTLDELAREGARRIIAAALDAEVADTSSGHRGECGPDGRALVVRNGKGRPRGVTMGGGTIAVEAPRVNDKRVDGERQYLFSSLGAQGRTGHVQRRLRIPPIS
jgi:hypothetical protein